MAKFTFDGQSYEIPDPDGMSTVELREVEQHTTMGLRSLARGLEDMKGDSIIALVYVAKRRAGEKPSWSDFDDVRPMVDVTWPQQPEQDEEEGQTNPPTKPTSRSSGSTQSGASSAT